MLIRRGYTKYLLALTPLAIVVMMSPYISVYMLIAAGLFFCAIYLHWSVFKWLVRKAMQ
jgi:hypothetical protein